MAQPMPSCGPLALKAIRRVAAKLNKAIEGGNLSALLTNENKSYIFTGIQPSLIKNMKTTIETDFEVLTIDRSVIYEKLVHFYLAFKNMPTSYQLFNALKNETPVYMDIAEFRKLLVKYGFMWKHITKNLFVVIEKPEVVFERYFYLTKILRYRAESRQIYFISENAFDDDGNYYSLKQLRRKSLTQPLHKIIFVASCEGIQCLQYIDDFSSETLFKYVKEQLLFTLRDSSVVVLTTKRHHCEEIVEAPTQESCRKDIMAWLDYFNVPYDTEMTRPVLYDLAQRYTDCTQKMYKVDELLATKGHSVLRIPKCIQQLTPITYCTDIIRTHLVVNLYKKLNDTEVKVLDVKAKLNVVVNNLTDVAPRVTDLIKSEEKIMCNKDVSVDQCIEELEANLRSETGTVGAARPSKGKRLRKKTCRPEELTVMSRDYEYDSEIPSCDSDPDE